MLDIAEKTTVPYDTISRASVSTQSLFTKCCCCIPLRVGCFILGYLSLILHTIQTIVIIVGIFIVGVETHGFDHLDTERPPAEFRTLQQQFNNHHDNLNEHGILTVVGIFLGVVALINVAWLALTVACLVGLHKKRPGPIRVYAGFAITRLLLAFVLFAYLLMTNKAPSHYIITHSIDLGLAAYFILVYYVYANQLEREANAEREIQGAVSAPDNGSVFIYPSKLDKKHLVA